MYSWIDECIMGLNEYYECDNVYDLLKDLGINIIYLDSSNILLRNNKAFYSRDFLGEETVFINNNLNKDFEKFILAHELGHALLHTDMSSAAFNYKVLNVGKLEKQANYFAMKLLDLNVNEELFIDLSCDQFIKLLKSHFYS